MWVLMTKGAVSIVKFNHAPEGDPRTMQVRSRRKEWIAAFARYVDRKVELIHSDDKDYQWRFFATPDEVAAAVGRAVTDIGYSNFKNATSAPGTGLRNAGLRSGLHSAYHKIWDTLLAAGDGTSLYDGKGSTGDRGTIAVCQRLGHWWLAGHQACDDCGTPNPAYPDAGPANARPSEAEVIAWWKAHPEKKPAAKAKAKSWGSLAGTKPAAKDAAKPKPEGEFSSTCPGSGLHAAKRSLKAFGSDVTGLCVACDQRVELNFHWEAKQHARPAADVIDQVAAEVPGPDAADLYAAREAASDYYLEVQRLYDRGEADDESLDDALDAFCKADDAYTAATDAENARAGA